MGKSQYTNCEGTEMEVDIACANKGNAAADGTPTKEICSYSDQPVQYDDAAPPATAAAGCGDHGSFDPKTHLIRDHATGRCRLNFVALINSCNAAPVVVDDGFGVMVEAPLSTGTGPGSHNHELNEDDNHKDNSGLLLRFSTNAGLTYYNNQFPRTTVTLDRSSPRRKLSEECKLSTGSYDSQKDFCYTNGAGYCWNSQNQCPPNGPDWRGTRGRGDDDCGGPCTIFLNKRTNAYCFPPCARTATFKGISNIGKSQSNPFETCFRAAESTTYCWTRSVIESSSEFSYRCVPEGSHWKHVKQEDMRWVNPSTNPYSCGEPCQVFKTLTPWCGNMGFQCN